MKLTKFEHACLDLQDNDTRLIVDPGVFSQSLTDLQGVLALVITHVHPDHFDPEKVTQLIAHNPDMQIFTTQEVAEQLGKQAVITPVAGEVHQVGSLTLEFFGGEHATISEAYPAAQNIGVLVNDRLYYPGDSLVTCSKPHEFIAVPTMAPWLKFSEADAFLRNSGAKQSFPTHNGFINQAGQELYDRLLGSSCQASGKTYQFLAPGTTIDI